MRAIVIAASNVLARACGRIAEWFEEAQRHLNRCPDCGRSRFYGEPCVK